MAVEIPNFRGYIYERDDKPMSDYQLQRYQYASTSHKDGSMIPALIVNPVDVNDVVAVLKYANEQGIAVAVRSGGHQYSGASSTSGPNIQLDLRHAFFRDIPFTYDKETNRARVSVSMTLDLMNKALGDLNLFVPHGQCSHVHAGGHLHTGGYGQLSRGFGLFGDHIRALEIVTPQGEKKKITRESDPDYWYAILGGSPGNFAIVTHLEIEPLKDEDFPNSRGWKVIFPYSKARTQRLLDTMVEMVDDPEMPGDLDYCVTILTEYQNFVTVFKNLDDEMRRMHPEEYGDVPKESGSVIPLSMCVVYLQWSNTKGAGQAFDPTWFDRIKKAADSYFSYSAVSYDKHTPMSKLTRAWVYPKIREYDLPYEKRTYSSNSETLKEDKWSEWTAERIHEIQRLRDSVFKGNKLSIQIQPFGGNNSQFFKGRDSGTSYSWRDAKIVSVMDCFYNPGIPGSKENALKWQKTNDEEGIGPNGKICKTDRRVFWGSFGNLDLNAEKAAYYDSDEIYDRLSEFKAKVDPNDVLTPNAFCIKGAGADKSVPITFKQPCDAELQEYDDEAMSLGLLKETPLTAGALAEERE